MFVSVTDSAAAADGGSLALFVERADGQLERFVINRSINSRGTPDYNTITSNLRSLSPDDCREIAAALEPLSTKTPPVHPLLDFIKTLKEQN